MVYLIGLASFLSTSLGGLFALGKKDKLHLILGLSAGTVIGVAFFDLLPESLVLTKDVYEPHLITLLVGVGFLTFMLLSRFIHFHPEHLDETLEHEHSHANEKSGALGAAGITLHSLLDGFGLGLAFAVSNSVGMVLALAVLAHNFSDGINTVGYILKYEGGKNQAYGWLVADALAPLIGILLSGMFTIADVDLGLILSFFCGFFLYIGASDLIPESQHRHPKLITSLMTILGAGIIYLIVNYSSL